MMIAIMITVMHYNSDDDYYFDKNSKNYCVDIMTMIMAIKIIIIMIPITDEKQ